MAPGSGRFRAEERETGVLWVSRVGGGDQRTSHVYGGGGGVVVEGTGTPARPLRLLCSHTVWQPGLSQEGKINSAICTFVPLSASDHFNFHKEASRSINSAQRWGVGFLLLLNSCGGRKDRGASPFRMLGKKS